MKRHEGLHLCWSHLGSARPREEVARGLLCFHQADQPGAAVALAARLGDLFGQYQAARLSVLRQQNQLRSVRHCKV